MTPVQEVKGLYSRMKNGGQYVELSDEAKVIVQRMLQESKGNAQAFVASLKELKENG